MGKYKKGERINSLDVLAEQEFIYWCGKVYHAGWFFNWRFGWVKSRMTYSNFYKAVEIVSDKKESEEAK
jgi:hypothetical protein